MESVSSPFCASAASLAALSLALREHAYHFVAITPASHKAINARAENRQARTLRDVFGWSRPFLPDVLGPDLFAIAAEAGVLMPEEAAGQRLWRSRVRAATLDGMLFLHAAFPTNSPDAVFFGPDTYRFADAIARCLAARTPTLSRAIDLGCGAGPGGLLIARAHPGAEIALTDINPACLAAARANALAANIHNITCRQSDLFETIDGQFDLIVANPPYLVDPQGRAYRHGGGMLGAALSTRIVTESRDRLRPGGCLLLYTGSAIIDGADLLLDSLHPLLNRPDLSWHYHEHDPDVFGEELAGGAYGQCDRIAAVVVKVERKS